MSRVIAIGDALIDELRDTRGVREFVGGAALNVAIGLSVLGVDSTLFAVIGDDADGTRIRQQLGAFRVEFVPTPAPVTGRAISVRGAGGEPTYSFTETSTDPVVTLGPAERMALAGACAIVVSGVSFGNANQMDALTSAIGTHTKLVIDPNPRAARLADAEAFRDGFMRLAARALLVKLGDDDAALLGFTDVAEARAAVIEAGATYVLTTLGEGGAEVHGPGVHAVAPIAVLPERIRDTMGAGDAVLATVVAAIAAHIPESSVEWQSVLDEAMLTAAATCRAEGALLRTPADQTMGPYERIAR